MISFNFRLIYGLKVLQKGLKRGPSDCIQISETSELPGAPWNIKRKTTGQGKISRV